MSSLFLFARFIILKTTQLAKRGDGGRSTTWIPSPWLVACGRRVSAARRGQPPRLNLMRKSLSPAKQKPIYRSNGATFSMSLIIFHPAVDAWFQQSFAAPTPAQAEAWPAIKAGRNVLIAAPTGSGKTLAAFLSAIDALVRQGLEDGLKDETQIVYVSPLRALSNDIHRNLEIPLAGIREALRARELPEVNIRTWVRTGDTPPGERQRMGKRPPHIVVTTPESLYILLSSESGCAMLKTTRAVIVDEIHALAPNKRGSHLALSLERLSSLCWDRLQRIGLSATQKPIEEVAHFLTGADSGDQ